jgi:transcriptional regulator GlxA family with amidase domain
MTSFSANPPHRIGVIAYADVMLLDIAGPVQVFQMGSEAGCYEISLLSRHGGVVTTDTGIGVTTSAWANAAVDTLIIPGGGGALAAADDAETLAAVRRLSAAAERTASVCMGAFILAAAGLLDGRRAATHWRYCARLAAAYPKIHVEPEPIFVQDGPIWSSAGVTSGIDLALALLEQDRGRVVALDVAQSMVVFLKRPGNQTQFSRTLAAQTTDRDGLFANLHTWMLANLAADLRVEALAERCAMTPRSFARIYADRMGETPAKAVEALRIEAARRRLEQAPEENVATIARLCGFGDDERMRRAFIRALGVAPSDYRERFGAALIRR